MNLFAHQKAFLERGLNKDLLCHGTGTGKTLTAIEWARGREGGGLFICPKTIKGKWIKNLEEHGLQGTVMTKEEFRAATTAKQDKKIVFRTDPGALRKYGFVVVDEAHHFSGEKSMLMKGLKMYVKYHGIEHILLATATPYRSTPWNVYVLASMLGYHMNYIEFRHKFFYARRVSSKSFREVFVPRKDIEVDIAKIVHRIGHVVALSECADIPEQTSETEYFDILPVQKKAQSEIQEFNPGVRYGKFHQIECGTLKGDEYTPHKSFESSVNERAVELALGNKKTIIVCRYSLQIEQIYNLLADSGVNLFVLTGQTKDRTELIAKAEAAERAIILVQSSVSEGYELPSFDVMVFASMDWSYLNYVQMKGRILRINKLKKNCFIHLITKGGASVSEKVYDSIMSGKDFDMAIYERIGLPDQVH